jgi:phage tail-like protein
MKLNEIEQLLPSVFQRSAGQGSPLYALLAAMETLHAPVEEILQRVFTYFSAYQTRDEFVPYLASWVDLAWLAADDGRVLPFPGGLGHLRGLIDGAADNAHWLGTARGLRVFLETATGAGMIVEDAQPGTFHLIVRAPAAAQEYEQTIRRIIETEKPAYATYEVVFA